MNYVYNEYAYLSHTTDTAVDQTEPLYRAQWGRTCLSSPNLIVPGEARPLKIAPEAIHMRLVLLFFDILTTCKSTV